MKFICLGSGKQMTRVNDMDTNDIAIAGVNNVWRGTDKWDYLIHAGDYPFKRDIKKTREDQEIHSREGEKGFKKSYVKMAGMEWENARIFLGLPIYFTLSYWVLYHFKPTHIAYLGFDMNYNPGTDGETAFYGIGYDIQKRGIPDPLYQFRNIPEYKDDPNIIDTLFKRLDERKGNCKLFNLSTDDETILPWERISLEDFKRL